MTDAGRVIAGSARGVRLVAPGEGTRPLADRVKQTLFAILEPDLEGARVLDLFAGSGAGGIEALSRGAASATFVEKDQGAASVIDANLRATGLAGEAVAIVRWDVIRLAGGTERRRVASTSSSSTRRTRRPTSLPESWGSSVSQRRRSRPVLASLPSTSGETARPTGSGC